MGVTLHLKQISTSTLETFKQDPKQVELFYAAQWLPESSFWQRATYWTDSSANVVKQESETQFGSSSRRDQFVSEWEVPDLDLHKYFPELTYLLAGYIPDSSEGRLALPELQLRPELMQKNTFMQFFIIEDSEWDSLPLVNAIWAGTQIGREGTNWYQTPEEVSQILNGLLTISEGGFQARYQREAESDEPCPWFDWEEEEMLEWLTDYYSEMVNYYQDATQRGNAMLADLSV
jgi:hypothetical protein